MARLTPFVSREGSKVQDLNHQQVSWHGWLSLLVIHGNRSTEVMHASQVYVFHVLCRVIIFDLAPCPVNSLRTETVCQS